MPITPWPHYADHPLALICRSRLGSYMPVGDTKACAMRVLATVTLGKRANRVYFALQCELGFSKPWLIDLVAVE